MGLTLLGSTINATIFASVASLIAKLTAGSADHRFKMEQMALAMHSLRMPMRTAARIRAYFEYTWLRHRDHAADTFIRDLPPQAAAALHSVPVCPPHSFALRPL